MARDMESEIRERRTILATKNNLMGSAGKLGTVLQAFGDLVFRHPSSSPQAFDARLRDEHEETYERTLSGQDGPLVHKDGFEEWPEGEPHKEGLLFDGLGRGMHIEVLYWHASHEMRVTYKGFTVYKEASGELYCYNPSPEWEGMIDKLYTAAKAKLKGEKQGKIEAMARSAVAENEAFVREMKDRWGV